MMTPSQTAIRQFHFRDRRPPHEIQFALERELMTLLPPTRIESQLTFHASASVNGVPYRVLLRLEAALLFTNCYLLQFQADVKNLSSVRPDRGGKYLDGWLDLWCRNFKSSPPPQPGDGSAERASKLAAQALAAEASLSGVPAIQQEILASLRRGASFSTAHKEGGTNISYLRRRFVRADFGESSRIEEFDDDAAFLAFLRKFYDWETSRGTYSQKVSEYAAWKLILRLLKEKR